MAKSLGGGFPIGAFWVREKYADVLSAGTHAHDFWRNAARLAPWRCKVLDVIERDHLAENAREIGRVFLGELRKLRRKYPRSGARGARIRIDDRDRVSTRSPGLRRARNRRASSRERLQRRVY